MTIVALRCAMRDSVREGHREGTSGVGVVGESHEITYRPTQYDDHREFNLSVYQGYMEGGDVCIKDTGREERL